MIIFELKLLSKLFLLLRYGGFIVSIRDFRFSGLGSNFVRGYCVVILGKIFYFYKDFLYD